MVIPSKRSQWLLAACLLCGAAPRMNAQGRAVNSDEFLRAAVEMAGLPDAPTPASAMPALPAAPQMRPRTSFDFLKTPLTPAGKFKWALRETVVAGVPGSAIAAGIAMATNSDLESGYEDGADGYGRRVAAALGQTATSHIVGDWALASMLHQDPRFHPSERRGFGTRLGWAISRVFVTQKDNGGHTFNSSRLFGIAAGAAAANGWHHDINRGGPETGERIGWEIVSDLADNVVREFWEYRKYPRQ